jgi:hypothetical protein
MPMLEEVPGAMERPGGCRIRIWQSEDGRETTLLIPPRETPIWMMIALVVLGGNLLVLLVTGLALFFGNHSILFMTQIAPKGLPVTMQRFAPWYALGWSILLALGFALLGLLLRPLMLRETITITPQELTIERRVWASAIIYPVPMFDLQGFRLKRDPQGLASSILTVRGRGEEWTIGEGLSEADREWLATVATALLRTL